MKSNLIIIVNLFLSTLTLTACSSELSTNNLPAEDDLPAIDSNYNSTNPKYIIIGKDSQSTGISAFSNECELFFFTFKNSSGRNIATPSAINVTFKDTTERYTSPFNPIFTNKNTYSTKANCNNNLNGSATFTIASGTSILSRWIKIPAETTYINNWDGDYYFQLSTNNSEIKVGHFSITSNSYGFVKTIDQTGEGYKILGPVNVVQDQCYKYIITYSKFDGTKLSLNSRTYRISNAGGLDFYSDSSCQNIITTTRNLNLETVYIKYSSPPGLTRLSPTVIPDPHSTTYILDYLSSYVFPIGTESHLELLGPTDISSMTCAGPFMITSINQYNATLANSSLSAKNINFNSTTLEVFSDAACMTSMGTNGSLQINSGDTGTVIYLKTLSSVDSQVINFISGSITGSKTIYINN